ncbi:MAG: glycoside hydrolase family 3 N-terminal domain-containing protein [Candidatus Sulfomarinibacteraceae bacterium]
MMPECMPLVVGIPGVELTPEQLETLEAIQPAGVILFERNVASADQVRELVAHLVELDPRPFVAVDLEGGAVNRLRPIWGELPSASEAAIAGRRAVGALGEAVGAACRNLGIHLDLAPVVDLDRPNGLIARQGRAMAADPERVAVLARVFNKGLASWGVRGCLKHFPGLGEIPVDTHEELPTIDAPADELDQQVRVFAELSAEIPIVMVGHVIVPALGDGRAPASLSPAVVRRAARLPGSPIILSDDIEMGALAGCGDLPERVETALAARIHGVLVCKAFERLPEIAAHLTERMATDSSLSTRMLEMAACMGTLRRDLLRNAAAVPAPDDTTVAQLWERARCEAASKG